MRYKFRAILILLGIFFVETAIICCVQYKIIKKHETDKIHIQESLQIEKMIKNDIKCFPVSIKYADAIHFEDSFGSYRENGGHEGCDIMYNTNVAGVVPIVSATNGTITNLGWLYLGGYRIGITSENGIYYYYAHFDSYAAGLFVGKKIKAGEFLGFMGNTGEGAEGTKEKFPVHLHFGIYINDENGNESSINPYQYLLKINEE